MPEYTVDLPAGGQLDLESAEEVSLWNEHATRYIDDFGLIKQNDLMLLGAILTHALTMFRAQQMLSDPKKMAEAQNRIIKASEQIRELEKALGIDKKTREAGGQHTVGSYVGTLKRAAHAHGIRISKRTKAYEGFVMELRWRVRLLRNGDEEDRRHHGVSEKEIINWVETKLAELEEADKTWAQEQGAVFVGRL